MNNIIRRIEISGFRSLDNVQIVCDSINVFTGINDVGKSNVLRALNLFFNGLTDLETPVNFTADYSKLSLAKAQKSSKKKQQIKIKLYFNAPASFKSLQNEELWIEKTYDRLGQYSSRSSLDDTSKKASLTRLQNSIRYYYIPALKGTNVLEFLLGEIGERNLLPQNDIVTLNQKVNDNLKDFASILSGSAIDIKTNFELPILVKDFWTRLNINTEFDELQSLEKNVIPSKKGKDIKLRTEHYQVSLLSRGEGVKSKYIPPLLKWIQRHEPRMYFIWGIDEPENSLEFRMAQEVADLYFNQYAINTQLFLTSHSLAFIFPSKMGQGGTIFRCVKTGEGDVDVSPLDGLFSNNHRLEVADELGALEIQKEVLQQWRKKEAESKELIKGLDQITQPVIFTEGTIDVEYWKQTIDLFGLSAYEFDIQPIGSIDTSGKERSMGRDSLNKAWHLRHQYPKGKKIVLFYDVDCNKSIQQDDNVVIYCPTQIKGQVFQKGIEHLVNFPRNFIKDEYLKEILKGDDVIKRPDKQKIKDYLFSLDTESKKICFKRLHDILLFLRKEYL